MFSNDYRYKRYEDDDNNYVIWSLVFLIFNFVFFFWRLRICEKFKENLSEVSENDLNELLINRESYKSFNTRNVKRENELIEN